MVKVDLEMACDRVNWDFLKETLEWANFSKELISLNMSCVNVNVTEILWNGEKNKGFHTNKRIEAGRSTVTIFICTL